MGVCPGGMGQCHIIPVGGYSLLEQGNLREVGWALSAKIESNLLLKMRCVTNKRILLSKRVSSPTDTCFVFYILEFCSLVTKPSLRISFSSLSPHLCPTRLYHYLFWSNLFVSKRIFALFSLSKLISVKHASIKLVSLVTYLYQTYLSGSSSSPSCRFHFVCPDNIQDSRPYFHT